MVIIDHVRGLSLDTLPASAVEAAKHCLLDWLGVTLSGSQEPVTRILREQASADGGTPECTVLGTGERVTVAQSCLIHGAAGHSQDYDDVLEMMLGHPTVPVAPVVFAIGERDRRSGADVLTAFVAGVEAEASVGVLVEPQHHERGWHTTATLGTFGAAAAASHLLGLDSETWNRAFGLAATQAGGLKSMFGTMAKPLHAGKAATQGYLAASLATRGMTGALDVLEAPRGFIDVTTPEAGQRTEPRELPLPELAVHEILFKAHAACYLTHSTIEGILDLRRRHRLTPGDVSSVEIEVLPVHHTTCAIPTARTGLEAKFSLAYSAAIAIVEGRAGEAQFTDAVVQDPTVRDLAARVFLIDGDPDRSQMATPVHVITRDGRRLSTLVDTGLPARGEAVARQWDQLAAKFMDLTTPLLGTNAAASLITLVEQFEELPHLEPVLRLVTGKQT